MSDKWSRGIERSAYIAITVMALTATVVLVKRYLVNSPPQTRDTRIREGTTLSLPEVDWGTVEKSVVLVLSTECHYCSANAEFYERLAMHAAQRETKSIRIIAIFPQAADVAEKYLSGAGVHVPVVKGVHPRAVGASVTPTVILVDNKGIVMKSWVGELHSDGETEILTLLR